MQKQRGIGRLGIVGRSPERRKGQALLHPNLGNPPGALDTFQVDTDEIDELLRLYSLHFTGKEQPELAAKRLGLVWKKLAGAPRLARLLLMYADLRRYSGHDAGMGHGYAWLFNSVHTAIRRSTQPIIRCVSIEDDAMYDYWLDG